MKAKVHFTTPAFVLHIDKHNLSLAFLAPFCRLRPVSLHLGLRRDNFNSSLSHSRHIRGSVPFVATRIFLIISPLIFLFSLPRRPLSPRPFLLPGLKRFTSPLSPCLGTVPPIKLNSYLPPPVHIPSSLPYLSIASICPLCNIPLPCPHICPPAPS